MDPKSRRYVVPGMVAVVVAALAGCGGGDDVAGQSESLPPEATTSATETSPSTTPPATDEPTSGPTEHAFPEAGLTVIEPAGVPAEARPAMDTYLAYMREWRRSLREIEFSDQLPTLAVPPVLDEIRRSLDYQEEHSIRYSGEMVVTPTVEDVGEHVVVLGGCMDGSRLTLTDPNGVRPVDGIDEHPVIPMRVVLTNSGAGWIVSESTWHEDRSC